jgi:hypothetical protein
MREHDLVQRLEAPVEGALMDTTTPVPVAKLLAR